MARESYFMIVKMYIRLATGYIEYNYLGIMVTHLTSITYLGNFCYRAKYHCCKWPCWKIIWPPGNIVEKKQCLIVLWVKVPKAAYYCWWCLIQGTLAIGGSANVELVSSFDWFGFNCLLPTYNNSIFSCLVYSKPVNLETSQLSWYPIT